MRQGAGVISYPLINLVALIMQAYGVKDSQIAGPDWLNTENYALDAKFPPNTGEKDVALMMQKLLAERFGLHLHRETARKTVAPSCRARQNSSSNRLSPAKVPR